MKLIIDFGFLLILIVCVWTGYKKGLIMGIGSMVSIIISLYVACLLSSTFSYEIVPVLRPFASGYADSQMSIVAQEKLNLSDSDLSLTDTLEQDSELRHKFCYETFRSVGIYDDAAEQMADEAEAYAAEHEVDVRDAVVEVLCARLTYVLGVALFFALALIALTAIGNIPNLAFKIPNMDTLNCVGGAVVGLLLGITFCVLITWLLRFLGIVIGPDTLGKTILGRFFLLIDFVTIGIGI